MTDNQFSFNSFFEHFVDWVKATIKNSSFRLMGAARKIVNKTLFLMLLLLFVPVILILLALSLGWGFSSWLHTTPGVGFLVAAAALVVFFFVVWLVILACVRAKWAKSLEHFLERMAKIDIIRPQNGLGINEKPLDTQEEPKGQHESQTNEPTAFETYRQ